MLYPVGPKGVKTGGQVTDLKGKTVLPEFIDAHMHVDETGISLNSLDLRGVTSIREMRSRLKEFSTIQKELVFGWGWDQELFSDKRWPQKSDVDDIVNDKPLLLSRVDGHAYLVNSHFLEILGIKSESGIIKEGEADYARAKIGELISKREKSKYALDALVHLLRNSITSIGFVSCSEEIFEALKELDEAGKLPIRVNVYVNPADYNSVKEFKDTERLKLKGIKLFTDGSLGSSTAQLSSPYADSDTYGEQTFLLHSLKEYSKKCVDSGRHVAIHAIGDSGMDLALSALEGLGPGNRIEHCAVIRDDQMNKFGGISIVVQPHFIHSDFWIINRLGPERAKWTYRFKDLIDNGINVAFSTDSPV